MQILSNMDWWVKLGWVISSLNHCFTEKKNGHVYGAQHSAADEPDVSHNLRTERSTGQAQRGGSPGAELHQIRAPLISLARRHPDEALLWMCLQQTWPVQGQGSLHDALLHVQTCPETVKGERPLLPACSPLQPSFSASLRLLLVLLGPKNWEATLSRPG